MLDNDSTPLRPVLHRWRSAGYLDLLRRALPVFGLASLTRQREAPPEVLALAERRQSARAGRDFTESDRLRAEIDHAGWEFRDTAEAYRLVPRE